MQGMYGEVPQFDHCFNVNDERDRFWSIYGAKFTPAQAPLAQQALNEDLAAFLASHQYCAPSSAFYHTSGRTFRDQAEAQVLKWWFDDVSAKVHR